MGLQGPQDSSFPAMRQAVEQAVGIVKADPGVDNVMGFTGGQGATNTGVGFIALKPLDQRRVSAEVIIDRLRPKLAHIPGAAAFLQPVQDIRIGGRQANAEYQYTLQAETSQDLQKYGPELLSELHHAPGFEDVNTDQQNNGLQALLTYDRHTAARLGVTPQVLDNTLLHLGHSCVDASRHHSTGENSRYPGATNPGRHSFGTPATAARYSRGGTDYGGGQCAHRC